MSCEWRAGGSGGVSSRAGESRLLYDGTVWSAGKVSFIFWIKTKVSIEIEDVQLCQFKLNNKQEKFWEL